MRWVEDVDELYDSCASAGIEVTYPPTNEPWHVREMHVRHPDGHVFRVSLGLSDTGQSEASGQPLKIDRVSKPLRIERRLAALLEDLSAHKGASFSECIEETVLHTFEPAAGGIASPHTPSTLDLIQELRKKHDIEYDAHASYRVFES